MTSHDTTRTIRRGYAMEGRPLVKDLWQSDSRPGNVALVETGNHDPDYRQLELRRYYDPDHAQREFKKVWMRSWIMACREEDLPLVGDRIPVTIGQISFFVVRDGPDSFKAFRNSCLHRGTELCSAREHGDVIRCPFHAWEWKLDGSLRFIPSHWDFRSVNKGNGALPQVRLGRWGGFIYINPDPEAGPFEAALGPIPQHFEQFRPQDRYTKAHFRKLVRANWKVVQEAFMESYHVLATHPGAGDYNGDSQSQYDIWEDGTAHVGRQVTPSGVQSVHSGPEATLETAAMAFAAFIQATYYPDTQLPQIDAGASPRLQVGEWYRQLESERLGRACELPDAVLMDSSLYFLFPHTTFWLTEALPFFYRFTPHETDPEASYFEVRMLKLPDAGSERPAPAPMIEIGADELIADRAPEFGFLAIVFDQDMANMPRVQRGVHSADPQRAHAELGEYQEFIIQHWHALMDGMLDQPEKGVSQ